MEITKWNGAIRGLFASIDDGIYSLIGDLYELIVDISNAEILNSVSISSIANKLYSFIGLFMFFKIAFSIINYIINPESISDKQKGGAKLVTNVIITFVLIIMTPFAFDMLRTAQKGILNQGIIANIFSDGDSNLIDNFKISEDCDEPSKIFAGLDENGKLKEGVGAYIALMAAKPFVQPDEKAKDEVYQRLLGNGDNPSSYCEVANVSELFDVKVIKFPSYSHKGGKNDDDYYTIKYDMFLSTVIGIIMVIIFASFCIDAALRTIKLTFLEIIAPIPIMSYIDPDSSKKGIFNKWLKEVGKTWADLFIRLAGVFFSIFLISKLDISLSDQRPMIKLMLMLGILLFAKKLPDMLKKMFNIDMKGDFSLNPVKQVKDALSVAKPVAGLATGTAGAILGATNAFRGHGFRQKLVNGLSGIKNGAVSGYKNPYSVSKGALSALSPYKKQITDKLNKKADEKYNAKQELKAIEKNENRGKKLFEEAVKRDSNGNPQYKVEKKIGKDGKTYSVRTNKYDVDEASIFKNDKEYLESYKAVGAAKKDAKKAKEDLSNAETNLKTLISNGASESEIKYATQKVNDLKQAADDKQKILDKRVEEHKKVQLTHTESAKREKALKEYKDQHPEELIDSTLESEVWYDENGNIVNPDEIKPSDNQNNSNNNNNNNSNNNTSNENMSDDDILNMMSEAQQNAKESEDKNKNNAWQQQHYDRSYELGTTDVRNNNNVRPNIEDDDNFMEHLFDNDNE